MDTLITPFRFRIGKTMTEQNTRFTCRLEKIIGTSNSGLDFVYKAAVYAPNYSEKGNFNPTSYVTIKYLRVQSDIEQRVEQNEIPHRNIVTVQSWLLRREMDAFCIALPYMSEGSLRYIISSRFPNGLPEDCIALVLKEALVGLSDVHKSGRVHKTFNAGDIFVNYDNDPDVLVNIKLAFASSLYDSDLDFDRELLEHDDVGSSSSVGGGVTNIYEWAGAPEIYYKSENKETFKSDIWLVGITALEVAYGGMKTCDREVVEALIKRIKKSKRLPSPEDVFKLEDDDNKEMKKAEKMKKVIMNFYKKEKGERVFSKEFEKVVFKCLSNNPSKRPTAKELLNEYAFFEQVKDFKWFRRTVLHGKKPAEQV